MFTADREAWATFAPCGPGDRLKRVGRLDRDVVLVRIDRPEGRFQVWDAERRRAETDPDDGD